METKAVGGPDTRWKVLEGAWVVGTRGSEFRCCMECNRVPNSVHPQTSSLLCSPFVLTLLIRKHCLIVLLFSSNCSPFPELISDPKTRTLVIFRF